MSERRVTRVPRPTFGRPPDRRPSGSSGWERARLIGRYWKQIGLIVLLGWTWSWFNVKAIDVKGTKQIQSGGLQMSAMQILHKHFWGNNLISLDTQGFGRQLVAVEPRIKAVKVVRRWPNHLSLIITEKQPALWWQTGQQNYLLDVDGSIIGPATDGQTLAIVVDSANLPVKVGEKVVPPAFVGFCTDLVQTIVGKTGVSIVGLKVPDTTSEVYATTNKGYLIKFDTTRDVGEQIDDLNNVLSTLVKQHKTPSEYIDLRIEHKAYYR